MILNIEYGIFIKKIIIWQIFVRYWGHNYIWICIGPRKMTCATHWFTSPPLVTCHLLHAMSCIGKGLPCSLSNRLFLSKCLSHSCQLKTWLNILYFQNKEKAKPNGSSLAISKLVIFNYLMTFFLLKKPILFGSYFQDIKF